MRLQVTTLQQSNSPSFSYYTYQATLQRNDDITMQHDIAPVI
jgi:hypothetical protein